MITDPISPEDIRYNPATACFEAKVTVHGAGPARVYACELRGDMSWTDDAIETAMQAEALRRHLGRPGLCSQHGKSTPRPVQTRTLSRPTNWFARLSAGASLQAA